MRMRRRAATARAGGPLPAATRSTPCTASRQMHLKNRRLIGNCLARQFPIHSSNFYSPLGADSDPKLIGLFRASPAPPTCSSEVLFRKRLRSTSVAVTHPGVVKPTESDPARGFRTWMRSQSQRKGANLVWENIALGTDLRFSESI